MNHSRLADFLKDASSPAPDELTGTPCPWFRRRRILLPLVALTSVVVGVALGGVSWRPVAPKTKYEPLSTSTGPQLNAAPVRPKPEQPGPTDTGPHSVGKIADCPCPPPSARRYINLTVPATVDPGHQPPLLLKATRKSSIIARQASPPGSKTPDIQVIEIEGDLWHYVGKNGNGVTGTESPILRDAVRSPDGRLWVVAEHNRFPFQIQGNQFCLFVLENDVWRPVGPRFGDPVADYSMQPMFEDIAIHFFSDSIPVNSTIRNTEDTNIRARQLLVRRIDGDRWVPMRALTRLADDPFYLDLVWRTNDAWLFVKSTEGDRRSLQASQFKGLHGEVTVGPITLGSWTGMNDFAHFAVSPDGTIAAVADDSRRDSKFLLLFHPTAGEKYKLEEVPFPPPSEEPIAQHEPMEWSPGGLLHVVRVGKRDGHVSVFSFAEGRWGLIVEAKESLYFRETIGDVQLNFREDSIPIVIWSTWGPVD